jgi:hypothetical protein
MNHVTTTEPDPDPCIKKIHEQTNTRIYERNLPSQILQPYLNVRPVMTKYSYFPVVDPRSQPSVSFQQLPTFNVHTVFNPGNAVSPWSGYASNINIESELKNQIYALQSCSQSTYVPNSNSDLYQNIVNGNGNGQSIGMHELLFKTENFCNFNPNPSSNIVGAGFFLNSTRSQIKEMTVSNKQ